MDIRIRRYTLSDSKKGWHPMRGQANDTNRGMRGWCPMKGCTRMLHRSNKGLRPMNRKGLRPMRRHIRILTRDRRRGRHNTAGSLGLSLGNNKLGAIDMSIWLGIHNRGLKGNLLNSTGSRSHNRGLKGRVGL